MRLSHLFSLVGAALAATSQSASQEGDYRHVQLRTHSITKPYLDQDFQSRWWDFGGTTVIDAANRIRLTHDQQHSTGWIWSRLPITATNYEIEFEFKIHGSGSLYGDGMAMWLTTGRVTTGPVFGNKDEFEGLGIFFDTYKNGRTGTTFPLVSAMIGDGKTRYDAAQDGKSTELAGCSARGLRSASIPTKGRLTYYKDGYLKLELQYKREDEWTECFNVQGISLPNVLYLGFTAITGEVSDNHDLIYVQSKNIFQAADSSSARAGKTIHGSSGSRKTNKSGWGGFFLKTIFFFALVGGCFVAWKKYQEKQRRNDYIGF